MTAKEIEQWKHERDLARSLKDPEERAEAERKVYDLRDDLMMNCIQHQADRVKTSLQNDAILDKEIKEVKTQVSSLKASIIPLQESDKDYRSWKLKIQGGMLLWKILKFLFAAGLGGTVVKLLSAAG